METLRFSPTTRLLLISRLPERFGEPAVGEEGADCGEDSENCFEVEKYSNKPMMSKKPGKKLQHRSPQKLPSQVSF